jgi:hypothetical protein
MTAQEKLGKAAYEAYGNAVEVENLLQPSRFCWDNLAIEVKRYWIAAAEAAVEADAMSRINSLFCAEHFNQAERGEVPRLEKCIVCIRDDMNAHLKTITANMVQIQGLMADDKAHKKAVGRFLSDMYCTMIDPLAEGMPKVEETCKVLLQAATEQRQREETLRTVLFEVKAIVEKSEHWWMDCPDKGGFDVDKIDAALGIAQPEVES